MMGRRWAGAAVALAAGLAPGSAGAWEWGDADGLCRVEARAGDFAEPDVAVHYHYDAGALVRQVLRGASPVVDGIEIRWERDDAGRPTRLAVFSPSGEPGRSLTIAWGRNATRPEQGIWDLNGDGVLDLVERWTWTREGHLASVQLLGAPTGTRATSAGDLTVEVGRFTYLWDADGRMISERIVGRDGASGTWRVAEDPQTSGVVIETFTSDAEERPSLVSMRVPTGQAGCYRAHWDVDGDGTWEWIDLVCRDDAGRLLSSRATRAPDASTPQHVVRREDGALRSVMAGPWQGWHRIERASGQPARVERHERDADGVSLSYLLDRDGDGTPEERRTVVRGCGD